MAATSLAGQIDHWRRELKDEGDTVSDFEHFRDLPEFFMELGRFFHGMLMPSKV